MIIKKTFRSLRRLMEKEHQKAVILEIFLNVSLHKFASEIIRTHSSNPRDIREVALEKLELSNCKKILDVGCGFGFFTEALRGRIHPEALVTGLDMIQGYEPFFSRKLQAIRLQGTFPVLRSRSDQRIPSGGLRPDPVQLCPVFFPQHHSGAVANSGCIRPFRCYHARQQ